jgi:outer membrane protein OmpA-like peptidoglycan-associated protein
MTAGTRRRAVTALLAGACLVTIDVAGPSPVARAQEGPDPLRDGALGTCGSVIHVDRALRTGNGLAVTLTLANHGSCDIDLYDTRSSVRSQTDARIGVEAIDPATYRMGDLKCPGGTCQTGYLPALPVGPGEAASIVAVLDDPGGATVDLVFDRFHPVLGIKVEGGGTPAAGSAKALAPRSFTPLPRFKEAAASTVGDGRIDLDTDVLFAFGKATLTPRASQTIAAATRLLKARPERRLTISGHTDGVGTPQANLVLSKQRAEAVRAALAASLGTGWTFDVRGYGETRPVACEKTDTGADYPAGRARNRRVELELGGP